ncbi:MAG: hypothetical protein IT580_23145 [Verrucomicrobiales bacterium]|nr:hypothetical protein [Verrucomicrobiales bacterium]
MIYSQSNSWFPRFLAPCWMVWLVATLNVPAAELRITSVQSSESGLSLHWQGGVGPYLVELSRDLDHWSGHDDPTQALQTTLGSPSGPQFVRLIDLDPTEAHGAFFGLLQTEQGEFGELLARHRLKTRLWLHLSRHAPHDGRPYTPADYWRNLQVVFQSHAEGRIQTRSGTLESLGTLSTPSATQMVLRWTNGPAATPRRYELLCEFPYPIRTPRTVAPFPSDPTYQLTCTYTAAQPELDFDGTGLRLREVKTDRVNLVQMGGTNEFLAPIERRFRVVQNGVHLDFHFLEGAPLYQGAPPWILKTLLLERWLSPTIGGGGVLPNFSTESYFARTLHPGHHNFWEDLLIEPALDPTLPEPTRQALAAANIKYLYASKDLAGVSIGGPGQSIHFFGFDGSVRAP